MPEIIRREFESLQELCEAASASCVNPVNEDVRNTIISSGFAGGFCKDRPHIKTWHAALAALRSGSFEIGLRRIAEMAARFEAPEAISVRRRMRWEDQGDEIDQQRVWAGNLDNAWRRARRINVRGPQRIRVAAALGADSFTNSSQLAWRGVAALVLADRLTEAGHIVEVFGFRRGSLNDHKMTAHVPSLVVKPYDAPMDVGALAAIMASPCLFRGAFLAHACAVARNQLDPTVSKTAIPEPEDYLSPYADKTFLIDNSVLSQDAAERVVRDSINQINSEARGEIAA